MRNGNTAMSSVGTVARTTRAERRPARRGRRSVVAGALLAGDAMVAIAAAVAASGLLQLGGVPVQANAALAGPLTLPTLAVLPIFAALGLYGSDGPSPPERLRLRALGLVLYAIACLLVAAGRVTPHHLGAITLVAGLLLVLGYYSEWAVQRVLIRAGAWGAPTLIIGADEAGRALARTLLAQPELGLRPIGIVADRIPEAPPEQLPLVDSLDATGLSSAEVIVFSSCAELARHDGIRSGAGPSARLLLAQRIEDLQDLWLQVRPLGGAVGLEIRRELYRPRNLLLKRMLDGVLAGLGLLVVAPLIALLAGLITLADPGSPFYVQVRVGRNGRPIRVLKLRTMYRDAEQRLRDHLEASPAARAEWQRFFKLADDPRVLPKVGHFLRRSSLDELPQLWNILRGDMSLVGPRPFPSYHLDGFGPAFRRLRTSVPPGLTGLWQISARSDGDLAVQESQDTYYIRNWSLWLDLYILLATIPAVLGAKGAR
ncbi:exopolysaccharide biosynthesis polyprenyl glycosylphosphotransferase [Methylobacterium nodulans]|uniref:Exopolysaccharide biosynthesis polyprenyl glycosylphosphotransferase n=1 Tax=Methylobacterium nodulans (strain LMG 21967 / CNCM I-2342 / ORS 2060) TaxID=460265 RepID=B8IQE2_METNO|nr:exopolysaccharide biosynthesis polyprenyl glycosylphosphotransferase [Methylobacterium nodulans]ACL60454.1 exopolysaccharide biosynthesis polyprenyl glycosylphosphotransferase [Methylobacterium nodulans ORS 2060]